VDYKSSFCRRSWLWQEQRSLLNTPSPHVLLTTTQSRSQNHKSLLQSQQNLNQGQNQR